MKPTPEQVTVLICFLVGLLALYCDWFLWKDEA